MSEPNEQETDELIEPSVADVPEPDQPLDTHEDAETDDAREDAQHEPEPDDAPQGLSQAEWEKRFAAADKRFETYKRGIFTLWGEDAHDLLPVSISPSAPPGFIHKADAGRVPDDVKVPIMEFFGIVREQDYAEDPETTACRDCEGKGKTKTGSLVPNHETRPCPTCKGWGYTTRAGAPPTSQAIAGTNGQNVTLEVGPLVTDDRDNWGEPRVLPDGRLNPNYGKQPQFKEPVEPYGITAGLGAVEGVT